MKRILFVCCLILHTLLFGLEIPVSNTIPEIIEDFQLSLTMVALLPFAFFIAYAVMSVPAGILVEKFGEKRVMLSAFVIAFLGALSLAIFHNYLTAIFSLFIIGAGMAMLQVAINPLLRTAGGEENFAFNSTLVQFFFGSASFLSPLIYSYLVLNLESPTPDPNVIIRSLGKVVPEELSWISMYWVFAILALLMVLLIKAIRFPKVELKDDERTGSIQSYLSLLKNPRVILFFFGIFFCNCVFGKNTIFTFFPMCKTKQFPFCKCLWNSKLNLYATIIIH